MLDFYAACTARRLACLAAAVAIWGSSGAARAAEEEARRVLSNAGLASVGDAWLCREEADVRRWLDAVEPMERQYQGLLAAVDARVAANDAAQKELAAKRKELAGAKKKLDGLTPSDLGPTREQLQRSHDELVRAVEKARRKRLRPDEFGEREAVRADVIRLANARAGIALAAAALRRDLKALPERYAALAARAEIAAALAALPSHRLGFQRDYEAEAAKRLARLDRIIETAEVPVYRDDNHVRVVCVVNETAPATFSLRQSDGPTHIPASLADSLGVDLSKAETVSYSAGGARKLTCRTTRLASVRVGGALLTDVRVLVLPPEGEDLGAKLGKDAWQGRYFDVDMSALRLTVFSAASEQQSARGGKLPNASGVRMGRTRRDAAPPRKRK